MRARLLLIALAVAAFAIPLPPALVERRYSTLVYPAIQAATTTASNLTAVAWLDVLIAGSTLALLLLALHDVRTLRWLRASGRIALRLMTVAAAMALAFQVMWGLNYQRVRLADRVPFDAQRVNAAAASALAQDTVTRLNAGYETAHRAGWAADFGTESGLAAEFSRAARTLGLSAVVPGRPKRSFLDLYFRRAGVAGMTDPFFLETLVASDLLPFERPVVVAHEWAHLAGITDEGEANFVAWLACVRGAEPHQYSAWLFLYDEVLPGLPRESAATIASQLAAGPRSDLQAMRERSNREVSRALSTAGWSVYDQYLKANRVESGTRSYNEVVRLVLGTNLR